MKVILTSKSEIKKKVVMKFLSVTGIPYEDLICISINNPSIPNQPINSALTCAKMRMENIEYDTGDLVISLENGVEIDEYGKCVDVCVVVAKIDNHMVSGVSDIKFEFSSKYFNEALEKSQTTCELGISTTIGELIGRDLNLPANNWMSHYSFNGHIDRYNQLLDAMINHIDEDFQLQLFILRDKNFKKGVVFKDLSPLLANFRTKMILTEKMEETIVNNDITQIDKIVGLDSRGYIYAMLLENICESGFVMARKKGKTPGKFRSQTYSTEYSQDTIEIQEGLIKPGDKVLIVDDLIATGGSLCATKKLVESFDAEVVAGIVILCVDSLFEKAQKDFNKPILVVLP